MATDLPVGSSGPRVDSGVVDISTRILVRASRLLDVASTRLVRTDRNFVANQGLGR